MNRSAVVMLLLGALAYYGFLRFKGVISGNPISPSIIVPRGAGS